MNAATFIGLGVALCLLLKKRKERVIPEPLYIRHGNAIWYMGHSYAHLLSGGYSSPWGL